MCVHPYITRSFRQLGFRRCVFTRPNPTATQTQSQVFALNEVGRDTVKVSGSLETPDDRFRLTLRGLSPYSESEIRVSLTGSVFQPRPLHLNLYQEQWPSWNWAQTPFLKKFRRARSTSKPPLDFYHLHPHSQSLFVLTRDNEYGLHLM